MKYFVTLHVTYNIVVIFWFYFQSELSIAHAEQEEGKDEMLIVLLEDEQIDEKSSDSSSS